MIGGRFLLLSLFAIRPGRQLLNSWSLRARHLLLDEYGQEPIIFWRLLRLPRRTRSTTVVEREEPVWILGTDSFFRTIREGTSRIGKERWWRLEHPRKKKSFFKGQG